MDLIVSEAFANRVKSLLAEWHVPGLSVATFNLSSTETAVRAFGLASIDPEIRATPDNLYDCASTSKSLTAAAVGHLVAQGHFQWTTTLASLLGDDWVLPDPVTTAQVTVEDILSHRSGMPGHDYSYLGVKSRDPDTPRSITRRLRKLPLSAPVRTEFQYNNMMFTVASYLVERISQRPFAEFLQTNFFDSLGMNSTYLQPSAVVAAHQQDRFSKPYVWRETEGKYSPVEHREQPEGQGAGLLQSTAGDYAKWVKAVMTKNPVLFEEKIYDDLLRPRIVEDADTNPDNLPPFTSNSMYALGWSIGSYRGYRVVEHNGAETGFRSRILFVPGLDCGLVLMGNAPGAANVIQILVMEVIDQLLDIPVKDRVDWNAKEHKEEAKEVEENQETLHKLREELSAEAGQSQTSLPLDSYTGTYANDGYHEVVVDIRDGQLFIDAGDRGMPFTITFEHVQAQKFIGHLEDDEGLISYKRAEFVGDVEGTKSNGVQRMGLDFSEAEAVGLIWFDRIS